MTVTLMKSSLIVRMNLLNIKLRREVMEAMVMLNIKQKQWINDYHETIYLNITPQLKNQERAWLREKSFKFNLSR